MRKKIVAGNWKMNLELAAGVALAEGINDYLRINPLTGEQRVILCTPFIHLSSVSRVLTARGLSCGAQNCNENSSGAYTGEVSAAMIRSTGATNVIIGHSERRTLYGEGDELLAARRAAALAEGLTVIFCCGELLDEREGGRHFEVVRRQLEKGLFNTDENDFSNCIIAYEPVWAIGTGVTATPLQAQEMHSFIRSLVKERYGADRAEATTILYGGSCNPSNAAELFANPDVDGGLIGGASLRKEDFCAIVKAL